MLFSHVKISSFRAKAHLVFHWCLYNKNSYGEETHLVKNRESLSITNEFQLKESEIENAWAFK